MAHVYNIGTKAWQPDATEGWVASEVTEKKVDGDKVHLVFQLEDGEVCHPRRRWRRRRRQGAAEGSMEAC